MYSLRRALALLKECASDRKLRLLGISVCRNIHSLLNDGRIRQAINLAERHAEQSEDDEEIIAARGRLDEVVGRDRAGRISSRKQHVIDSEQAVYGLLQDPMAHGIDQTLEAAFRLIESRNGGYPQLVEVFHDIFGNPFRPVSFDPDWRTSTAVAIAKGMYESRDFALMPLLADALQDADCDHAGILDHCRGAGPHVRGC